MTKHVHALLVGLVAAATTAAVLGTPAIVAGITFRALE
jgi:hypothetical protein